jgi:hypothetical protein
MKEIKMVGCSQFFSGGSGAFDFVANHMDLSSLEKFHSAKAWGELGDNQFEMLCTKIFKRCPKLQEIDLSDGNICHLDVGANTDGSKHSIITSTDNMSVLTCLPTDTLRVLELSRNPALCPKFEDDARCPKPSPESVKRNIQALWYLVARYPNLGFVGKLCYAMQSILLGIVITSKVYLIKVFSLSSYCSIQTTGPFNLLFLGRLGENYDRLSDYYRLVHELCLNRARSRILKNQPIRSRGVWSVLLSNAVRAYDDYPNHILARNRKEPADAIYHLLRERGAVDLFF